MIEHLIELGMSLDTLCIVVSHTDKDPYPQKLTFCQGKL